MTETKPNLYILKHKKLRVVGLEGTLEGSLDDAEAVLRNKGMETAKFMVNSRRGVQAISFTPIMDIGVLQRRLDEQTTTLVVRAINRPSLSSEIIELVSTIGLHPDAEYNENFYGNLPQVHQQLALYYTVVSAISKKARATLNKAFGSATYTNFLENHRGYTREEAIEEACRRFRIKL